jgi:Flp pilus assembly protein TadG
MNNSAPLPVRPARGVATVEFAIVSLVFFTMLFAILEFARLLYVHNTLQEVTRRGARAAVVRWVDQEAAIKQFALFGGTSLPAGAEITTNNVLIEYLAADGTAVTGTARPTDPSDNLSACGDALRTANCIFSVRVSIVNATYTPLFSLFSSFNVALPGSSVTMHAESMGFESS